MTDPTDERAYSIDVDRTAGRLVDRPHGSDAVSVRGSGAVAGTGGGSGPSSHAAAVVAEANDIARRTRFDGPPSSESIAKLVAGTIGSATPRPIEPADGYERRRHLRQSVSPMYTTVEAKPIDRGVVGHLLGHVYDISIGGVRVELDERVACGERLGLALELPSAGGPVHVLGRVTRVTDADDDPASARAGIAFESFASAEDESRLRRWLGAVDGWRTAA